MLAPNTILQNRYRVVRELGHGGMGTVYEALDQRVNCIVVLKETIAGNNDEARRAFEREASLLKVIRGGSYESTKDFATTTYRTGWPARGAKTYDQTGFRCVQDVQ